MLRQIYGLPKLLGRDGSSLFLSLVSLVKNKGSICTFSCISTVIYGQFLKDKEGGKNVDKVLQEDLNGWLYFFVHLNLNFSMTHELYYILNIVMNRRIMVMREVEWKVTYANANSKFISTNLTTSAHV